MAAANKNFDSKLLNYVQAVVDLQVRLALADRGANPIIVINNASVKIYNPTNSTPHI
jgi:hypothetical protein